MRLTGLVVLAAAALAVAAWAAQAKSIAVSASLPCGQLPSPRPHDSAPTPMAAPTPPGFRTSAPQVVPIGTWSTCFRPAVVTIEAGETVQWQQIDSGPYRIVLDRGAQLGSIRMILEVRFNRPGTYHYHGDPPRDANGTIVVEGTTRPGPEFEIFEIPLTGGQ
jgi:plastocyanin